MAYARKNANSVGRPFVAAPVIALGVSSLDHLQSGQHIRVLGHKKLSRFVRERETGRTYIVSAPKGSRVSMAAFRLSVGVDTSKVVTEIK
jgi:hypothetical protein